MPSEHLQCFDRYRAECLQVLLEKHPNDSQRMSETEHCVFIDVFGIVPENRRMQLSWLCILLTDKVRWRAYRERMVTVQRLPEPLDPNWTPLLMATAKPWELFPESWVPSRESFVIVTQKDVEDEAVSDQFRCKCGERKTVVNQKQTRSADEPMTVFIRCVACGNRWKQ